MLAVATCDWEVQACGGWGGGEGAGRWGFLGRRVVGGEGRIWERGVSGRAGREARGGQGAEGDMRGMRCRGGGALLRCQARVGWMDRSRVSMMGHAHMHHMSVFAFEVKCQHFCCLGSNRLAPGECQLTDHPVSHVTGDLIEIITWRSPRLGSPGLEVGLRVGFILY